MEIMAALYWTPNLIERFQNTHNYSLTPYLPLLFSSTNTWGGALPVYSEQYVFGNYTSDGASVHQLDYRKVLNDGYQDYITHFANWTHSKGVEYSNQPGYNLPLQMVPLPSVRNS